MSLPLPRLPLPLPSHTPSWYAGHMAAALRDLPALLRDVDLVLEARDARLPLTSVNPALDEVVRGAWGGQGEGLGLGPGKRGRKRKVVVYTKRDLAERRFEQPLRKAFVEHAGQDVLFADTRVDRDVRAVLKRAVDLGRENDPEGAGLADVKVLVVGMPNVGKSSLLNALRRVGVHKGKAFRTGSFPGLTRRLTGTVRIHSDPNVYVYDTPGVMPSFLGRGAAGSERAIKLALTRGMREGSVSEEVVAGYLLWRLNLRQTGGHEGAGEGAWWRDLPLPQDFAPTTDLHGLLVPLARRLGALKAGGVEDVDAAQAFFLKSFREGKFGPWTMDDLLHTETAQEPSSSDPLDATSPTHALSPPPLSLGPLPSTELSTRVSSAVRAHLASLEAQRQRRAEGSPESTSQERKLDKQRKAAERTRRAEARMERRASGMVRAKR